jgi:hypothetical protein
MRLRIPSLAQIEVRDSKGMRTPGRGETVSKMASRGLLPTAREAEMAAVKVVMRVVSEIG